MINEKVNDFLTKKINIVEDKDSKIYLVNKVSICKLHMYSPSAYRITDLLGNNEEISRSEEVANTYCMGLCDLFILALSSD